MNTMAAIFASSEGWNTITPRSTQRFEPLTTCRVGGANTANKSRIEITVAAGIWRRITKYDREGGASTHRKAVDGEWTGEPVFVPRSKDAAEDDGFVLFAVHDAKKDETSIEILDARGIDAAPLAKLHLDTRIPYGFHGNWAGSV